MTQDHFSRPDAVASYLERTRRSVPGIELVHRLCEQILAESVPAQGRVLVVGAGGGIELAHLAALHAGWTFDGVDPSAPMLRLVRATMGQRADRAALHEGDITSAPPGPFDAATCLLTLHFLPPEERLLTLAEIRRRLDRGAPLVTFHHSVVAGEERADWIARQVRFAAGGAADPATEARGIAALSGGLPILSPDEDEALLREAGFTRVGLFYAALTFRGWVAYA